MRIGIGNAMRCGIGLALCAGLLAACTSSSTGATAPTRAGTSATPADSPTSPSADPSGAAYDDPTAVQAVLAAARADFPLLTSYDYRHLTGDLGQGLAVTTGSFSSLYESTMRKTIFAQAAKLHVVQTTTVTNVGLVGLGATQAEALVFADEKVTDTSSKTPQLNGLATSVVLTKDGSAWKVSALRNNSADPPDAPGTTLLKQSVTVGEGEAAALLIYRRHSFAQDLATAEAGASGNLLTQVKSQAAKLQTQLITGHFDLTAEMHATAIESVTPRQVVLLVAADGYKVPDKGARTLQSRQRLEVDVVSDGQRWHVDNVTPVA